MIKLIRNYLQKIVDDIDAGNSNISEQDGVDLILALRDLSRRDRELSKYEAARYLNVSRATFDNYVKDGKLPKGTKIAGFKELSWDKRDLDSFAQKLREQGNAKKVNNSNV